MLDDSEVFQSLPVDERKRMARSMVEIGEYLARDPGWLDSEDSPQTGELAEALGPVADLKKRLASAPGQIGQDFEAGAVRQGVEQFRNLVDAVDFPDFVSGLIQGVFQAIVDASIHPLPNGNLKLNVGLIDLTTNNHVWSASFDTKPNQLDSVLDAVSSQLRDQLSETNRDSQRRTKLSS